MIGIVIPVYNRKDFTRQCLDALYKQTYTNFKIIVVDDGSTDGTAKMIYRDYPEVSVLPGNGKLFWTAAVNMGIKYALTLGADYILTLNNDGFPEEKFLYNMLRWSRLKPDALLCAYEIDAETRHPYYGGEVINPILGTSKYLLDHLPEEKRKGIHPVSVAPGRGLLIPKKVFDRIGLFNQKLLPHYMADFDFACLAKRKGFDLYCNYDAKLFTYSGESGDKDIIRHKSIANYFKHLFSIKGGGNLKNFTIYTFRNSPAVLVPFHLIKGYSQRILGYLVK